ncbi:extracellular solute-binding protein [Oceanobacillus neutriphilus]|uniref:Sugar ABC transporter substrate-binding protein n=1 Tax=Oceanobacillus neutriphilus TaxID=531815 RepID=A0ABQ2NP20_9BACI|nr:extracellular solute-binding protein [Oceanobacillus neutriphilus]GGP06855.1 sugar ABC transporter substrate-binding protein [Oceanobacillus neutriphilus]
MKQTWRLLVTLMLFITIMAACGSDEETKKRDANAQKAAEAEVNKEGLPIVDEEIQLTMMAPGNGIEEWENMELLKDYTEKTNIQFKYVTPPVSDFQTKLNLAFTSGDIGDIIYGAGTDNLTPGMEVDYGEQGVLIPLEELIEEYAPNLKKLLEERPDIKKSITTVDGHIYSLPMVSDETTAQWYTGPLWYNGKWLEELGVEELPKTTDEFYELLKRFKEEDPNGNGQADEIPLLDVKMESSRPWLLAAFGIKEWGIEENNGKVRYAPMEEAYKEYLTYMHKLYEEGLLDSETFSQSDEQKKAKGQDSRIGVFPDWYSFFTTGEPEEEAVGNPMFYPLTNDNSREPVIPLGHGMSRGAFSISESNPNPAASIRWIDYFYSSEGFEYLNMGPEGHLWEWEDEEEGTKQKLDTPEGYESSEDYRGSLTPDYGITTPSLRNDLDSLGEDTLFEQFIKEETAEKIEPFGEIGYPLVYLTKEEQKEVNNIEVDLNSYVEQMEAKFITGVEPLSNWDNYVDTIEKMNIKRYVEIYQDAYNRWKEND